MAIKDAIDRIERDYAGDFSEALRAHETNTLAAAAVFKSWKAKADDAAKKKVPIPLKPAEADAPPEPLPKRLTVADATVEAQAHLAAANPHGLLLLVDELAGTIGNWGKYGGDGDAAYYLSAFSGASGRVDRVGSGSIIVPHVHLSIIGGIQPERLEELVLSRVNDGLVPRFLVVWPDPIQANFWAPHFDESTLDHIFNRLVMLRRKRESTGETVTQRIPFTAEAQADFEPWYVAQTHQAKSEAGFMGEFLGKSPGICARIALVLEHLDWAAGNAPRSAAPRKVTPKSVERACTLMNDYFEPMARRVYADASLSSDERVAVALLKTIRKRRESHFNAREAKRNWGIAGLRKADDMNRACAVLVEADCIRQIEAEGPGRHGKNFLVNPRIWAANENWRK